MGILLGAILPALVYAFIVYTSTPFNSVNLRTSLTYGVVGMTSILLVYAKFIMFPSWVGPISFDLLLNNLFHAFIQVALIEEFCKFLSFKVLDVSRISNSRKIDLPITTMFYSMMVSGGFAILENVGYARNYGDYVLVIRSFTAVLAHMISGLIMGYFIALGNMDTNLKNTSVLNVFLKRHHKYRVLIFSFFGILASTFYHGLYDFIIINFNENSASNIFYIISGGFVITYLMGKHLILESNKVLTKYLPVVNIKKKNDIKKRSKKV